MSTQYLARCMKCRKQMEIQNPKIVTTQKGRKAVRGTCVCGTNMFKFLPKNNSATVPNTKNIQIPPTKDTVIPQVSKTKLKKIKSKNIRKEMKDWDEVQL